MMFSPPGYLFSFAITKDPRLSLIGGMLGTSPAGILLVVAAANQGQIGTAPGTTAQLPPSGPQMVQVPEVPDDQDQAKQVLESRELVAATQTVLSEEPIDAVIGSDPSAESVVSVGSTVTILVSAGLEVPDVTGNSVDDADRAVQTAGFAVERRNSDTQGTEDTVERQDPPGGTFADAGSTVTLYVIHPRKGRLRPAASAARE